MVCNNGDDVLYTSGLSAAVTVFDEVEIVAGDLVKVELDLDVFTMMQEAAGLRSDGMREVILSLAIVYMTVYT